MDLGVKNVSEEHLLSRTEASDYLRGVWKIPHSIGTLAKLAVVGGGPEFRKAGRIPLYPQDGLDAYARAKLTRRVRSTSELDAEPTEKAVAQSYRSLISPKEPASPPLTALSARLRLSLPRGRHSS